MMPFWWTAAATFMAARCLENQKAPVNSQATPKALRSRGEGLGKLHVNTEMRPVPSGGCTDP